MHSAHHAFIHVIHEWNEPYLPVPLQAKLALIYRPRMDGRLSWPIGITAMCKQSAKDRYVTGITAVSCTNCHWANGAQRL